MAELTAQDAIEDARITPHSHHEALPAGTPHSAVGLPAVVVHKASKAESVDQPPHARSALGTPAAFSARSCEVAADAAPNVFGIAPRSQGVGLDGLRSMWEAVHLVEESEAAQEEVRSILSSGASFLAPCFSRQSRFQALVCTMISNKLPPGT